MPKARSFDDIRYWTDLMQPWPKSWAGTPDDIPIGQELVALMIPFVRSLHRKNFTRKTIRRHVDHLWCIGGEIIRDLNSTSAVPNNNAKTLLHQAIADGIAPRVNHASESEQLAVDATARKLATFLTTPT